MVRSFTFVWASLVLLSFSTDNNKANAQVCPGVVEGVLHTVPGSEAFGTEDLIEMAQSSQVIQLRYLPNEMPEGWDQPVDCPHHQNNLMDWHDRSLWPGNQVPSPGSDVILPEGVAVLVSGCSLHEQPYGSIEIPATSSLVFNDHDILLSTSGITVYGNLSIGSPTCRMNSNITIELTGPRPDATMPASYKGILVAQEGLLDAHGALFYPSWTRLAKTALPGDTEIFLQHKVSWQPGHRIVLVATELKDSRDWHRNEERQVAQVVWNGEFSKVVLTEALQYTHFGTKQYQGEVGLLSRRVVIQGDAQSEPTDVDAPVCSDNLYTTYPCPQKYLTGFGGHVMIAGSNATGRVSGVEFFRMGQTNFIARYPFHLHMIGENGFRSFIKDSSVHHSFYRCITVHGTNNALVEGNVAFDAIGHCIYLEDGVEEQNTISFNLAAHIHFLEYPRFSGAQFHDSIDQNENLTNPADTTAGGFYITNPHNRFFGNAASGGYSGFSVVKLPTPIMSHRDVTLENGLMPFQRTFIEFDGNSCHSSGWWWVMAGCIYVGGLLWHPDSSSEMLRYNPGRNVFNMDTRCNEDTQAYPSECDLVMTNTKVFLTNYGIANWGQRGEVVGIEAYDTNRGMSLLGSWYIKNYLSECRTGLEPERPTYENLWETWSDGRWWTGSYQGFQWYDTAQFHILLNSTFRNCGVAARNSPVFESLTHSDRYTPGFLQATKDIRFENCEPEMIYKPSVSHRVSVSGWLTSSFDTDGTYSLSQTPSIVGNSRGNYTWWRLDPDCTSFSEDWYSCPDHSLVSRYKRNVAMMEFVHKVVEEKFDTFEECGNQGFNGPPCPAYGYAQHLGFRGLEGGIPLTANPMVSGPTSKGSHAWLLVLDSGSPVQARFLRMQVDQEDDLVVALPYPQGTSFSVQYKGASWCNPLWSNCEHSFTQANSVVEVKNGSGDLFYYDVESGLLFLKLIYQNSNNLDFDTFSFQAPYFQRDGIRIPGIMWGGEVVVNANCSALNASNPDYCAFSFNEESVQDPCSLFGMENHVPYGFDECIPSTLAPTVPQSSVTNSPSKSPVNPEDDNEEDNSLNASSTLCQTFLLNFLIIYNMSAS